MNFSALTRSLLLGSVCAAISHGAMAQRQPTVFMLQFGSFETRDEADAKIKSIGTKHGGMLTKYPPLIREITMPPDNLTVYRTQAGPVTTRETAQSVCSQLASQGDECYVVETAMNIPGTPKVVQQAGIIPTDEKPIPSRDPDNLKMLEKVSTPVPEAKKTAMTEAMDKAAAVSTPAKPTLSIPAPRVSSDAQLVGATKTPEAATEEKEGSFWSWLGGDDEDETEISDWNKAKREGEARAAKAAANERAAPVDEVATIEMPAPSAPPAPLVSTTPPAPKMEVVEQNPPINTFARKTEQPRAMMPPPEPMPRAEAPQAPLAPAPTAPTPFAQAPFSAPAPVLAPQPTTPPAPMVQEPIAPAEAQLGSGGLKLPPPPPPSNSVTREALERNPTVEAPLPVTAEPMPLIQKGPGAVYAETTPEPLGGTITTNALPAAPFKQGVSVPAGGGEPAAKGDVQVGEAQRVPLTESQQQAPVEQLPAKVIGVNEKPEEAPNTPPAPIATPVIPPSSSAFQKTLWAHIHYFPDQQAALSFWDAYRNAHPDFPVVRVRTTSSLIAQQQGDMRVSLRIGPFAQQGFIGILCNSVKQTDENLQCGAITDMGASANAYAPRDRYAQAAAASARYTNKVAPSAQGFWVQLGTFPSADAAQIAWQDATTQHSDALSDMKPAIVSPEQGSHSGQVFRLRTGPFGTQMAAKDLCSRVKVNSGSCLVVSE